jgi:hypothetical protein
MAEQEMKQARRKHGAVFKTKVYRYASRRDDDANLRARGAGGATAAVRYRRLHFLLRREGIRLNYSKLFRLYREERLTVATPGWAQAHARDAGAADAAAKAEPALKPGTSCRTCWPMGDGSECW